jgi:hypothetical protein
LIDRFTTKQLKQNELSDKQLETAKVANRDMVRAGLFNPIEISDEMMRFALLGTERKAAQPVPIGQLGSTRGDLIAQSLRGKFIDPSVKSSSPSTTRASNVLREEEINKILTGKP